MKNHKEQLKSEEAPYMHWQEWSESYLHLTDLTTATRTSQPLPDYKVFPYYCRAISIPYNRIFVCGGRDNPNSPGLRLCWILQLKPQLSLQLGPPMATGRSNHCMALCKDFLYILGGCDEKNAFTNQCERLNLKTYEWERIMSTNEIRDTAAGAGLPARNVLYICGGRIENTVTSNTFEKYEIGKDVWYHIPVKLPLGTSVHGVAHLPGEPDKLLVFAGQDAQGASLVKACIMNMGNGKAEREFEMPCKGGCVVNETKLVAGKVYMLLFHGYNTRSLESWDVANSEWKTEAYS